MKFIERALVCLTARKSNDHESFPYVLKMFEILPPSLSFRSCHAVDRAARPLLATSNATYVRA